VLAFQNWIRPALAAACLAFAAGASAASDVLYETSEPGGMFGYWGMDVFDGQSVGARFTVPEGSDVSLGRIGIYFMSNSVDFTPPVVHLSLQTDALDEGGSETLPSGVVLESWDVTVTADGWDPVQEIAESTLLPTLQASRNYWVVAESADQAGDDGIWTFASSGTAYATTTYEGSWQTAGEGAAPTLLVEAAGGGGDPSGPSISLHATPRVIQLGKPTQLVWNTSDASSCRAQGGWSGSKATAGTETVVPTAAGTQVYALTCSGSEGKATAKARVLVRP